MRIRVGSPSTAGSGPEDKVVRTEELTEGASAHRVHGARLKIHEDRTRDIAAAGSLVVVHVDALELQVRVTVVRTRRVDTLTIALILNLTKHLQTLR